MLEKKSPGQDGFTKKNFQTFKKELTPFSHNPQKTEEETMLNSFYEDSIALTIKLDKVWIEHSINEISIPHE